MLNNIKTKERGFTIVELLIVIVVIAILAAISIVAFSGIQQRGRDSARQADTSNINKALIAYTSDDPTNGGSGGVWPADASAAKTALGGYSAANLSSTLVNKIGADPTSSANTTYGYKACPTTGTKTGAQITWWKEQGTGALQTVNVGVVGTC